VLLSFFDKFVELFLHERGKVQMIFLNPLFLLFFDVIVFTISYVIKDCGLV
jgi:hypothetical protein